MLAERIALLSWRLHRVTRYETESIALSQEKVEEDLIKIQRFGPSSSEATRPQDVRVEYEEAEKIQRLLKKESTLPADKRLSTGEAAHVLLTIWYRVNGKSELEELEIPGIPDALDPELLFEYDVSWTVVLVREGISVFAQFADETPEKLLETAAEDARYEVRRTKRRLERDGAGPERHEQGAPLARRDDPAEDRALEAHLSRTLSGDARVGGSANKAKRWRSTLGPPRCAGSRKLKTAKRTSPNRLPARACLITRVCL